MDSDFLANLSWLLPAPPDFRKRCGDLLAMQGPLGQSVRTLAMHALNENQLGRLSNAIAALSSRGADLSALTPFKLGLAGNGNLDLILPTLAAGAARHGILLHCIPAGFGQTMQEALDPASGINRARPDAVLLCLDYRAFPDLASPQGVADALTMIRSMREGFRRNGGALSIVQTFAPPAEPLFGSLDRAMPQSLRGAIGALNRDLAAEVAASADILFDVAALAELVGLASWHSPAQWNLARLPFSAIYLPLFAEHVGRLIGAMRGKSRRCLVLDLDNTIWGGVIGDDGIEGIRMAEGDAVGEAFLAVQRMALMLRERGIVLAVCSKNNDAIARAPFRQHPEMLLREHHLAVFLANWNDKAANIKAIAETLRLSLESLVFVDDNPAERRLVREFLPQVAVPELGEDPALYARAVLSAGYFETIAFSKEDRQRADFYQNHAAQAAAQTRPEGIDSYLAGLNMEIVFSPFDSTGRTRITQLINKSNQFNLTTRRYDELAVRQFEQDPSVWTLQVRLIDRFGDNGMISVVICKPRDATSWEIDTWLMSCRVLGREVERAVLREILSNAAANGIKRLVGVYLPTERNALVRDHYKTLGFSRFEAEGKNDGAECWVISTDTAIPAAPITVRRAIPDAI